MRIPVLVLLLSLVLSPAASRVWILDESGSGDATRLEDLDSLSPGDTVQFRGTFTAEQIIRETDGTSASPITLESYPGTTAILDGTGASVDSNQGLLQINSCSYIKVQGLIIRNSAERGINLYLNNHITIYNNTVHDIQYRAIGGCSDHVVVDKNIVYNAVLSNSPRTLGSGWQQAVSCSTCTESLSVDWVFSNNLVYNSYGEGIDCVQVDGCVIRANLIYDTYSVNIYMDDAANVLVEDNYVYSTNTAYYKNGKPATGVLVGAESWPDYPTPSINVTIRNNLLVGTGIGNYQEDSNYVSQVQIYYNTIWATKRQALYWPNQPITPTGNELRNNILYSPDGITACDIEGQLNAWTFSNNVWLGVNSVPASCADTSGSTSIAIADPAMIGFTGDYEALAPFDTAFTLNATSPARGAAAPLASITTDYFGGARSASAPSAGFAEYGTDTSGGRGNTGGSASSASASASSGSTSGAARVGSLLPFTLLMKKN